jgi:hypothetical protein
MKKPLLAYNIDLHADAQHVHDKFLLDIVLTNNYSFRPLKVGKKQELKRNEIGT